jgi:hypothetical protein
MDSGFIGVAVTLAASAAAIAMTHERWSPRTAVLGVALLSGASAPIISAVLLTIVFPPIPGIHSPSDFLESALLMCIAALLPAGTFAFIAGIPFGLWWTRRGRFLRLRTRMIVEAAALGLALGLAFPFYFRWVIRWGQTIDRGLVLFSGFAGAICSLAVALLLTVKSRTHNAILPKREREG